MLGGPEDLIILNVQNDAEVQKINFARKTSKIVSDNLIDDCKTKIAVLEKELRGATEAALGIISLSDAKLDTYARYPNETPPNGHESHPVMLHCIKRAASDTIQNATTRINTEVNGLRDEVAKC